MSLEPRQSKSARPWDEWQATPAGKLDVRALFDRMAGESPITYAARKEAEVERLREALERIANEGDLYGTRACEALVHSKPDAEAA